jgi:hypothetical protein
MKGMLYGAFMPRHTAPEASGQAHSSGARFGCQQAFHKFTWQQEIAEIAMAAIVGQGR